jgi:TrmH family RNA methyltransferase
VPADTESLLAWIGARGVELVVAAGDGEPIGRRPRGGRAALALALGNEGAGVGPGLAAAARRRVAIPLARGVESLNVAIAAGILLYEVTRDV